MVSLKATLLGLLRKIEIMAGCLLVINLLEDVLEASIVLLEDGVLGGHVKGQPAV